MVPFGSSPFEFEAELHRDAARTGSNLGDNASVLAKCFAIIASERASNCLTVSFATADLLATVVLLNFAPTFAPPKVPAVTMR